MGVSALSSPNGKVKGVDIDGFVRRLFLFERYLLVSVRLEEFRYLAQQLGFEGLRDLLSENVLEVRCECMQLAQVGQAGMFGDRRLPPYHYKFNWVDAHDKEKYVNGCLDCLNEVPKLSKQELEVLREGISKAIRPLSREIMRPCFPEFVTDLSRPRLLDVAVRIAVAKKIGAADLPIRLTVHQVADDTFRVDNNIAVLTKITTADAHRIVEAGLLGLAGLSQAVLEMEVYSALSGFRDEEMPLFREKLSFLADLACSRKIESEFQRVIEIKNLPHFSSELAGVSVDRILKIRNSSEAREFRDWLSGSNDLTDREINDRVAGLRARAGLKIGGTAGKAVRFLATTVAGVKPAAGFVASALDTFVFDKLLPRSGIAAFVNELYPSIFERSKQSKKDDLRIINRE